MERNIIWEPFHFDFQKDKEKKPTTFEDLDFEEEIPRIMETPFGIFKVDDSMNPFKTFDFWIGHTNFVIDDQVFDMLNNTLGVESLNVISPYRFIISIGKAFNIREVRPQIEHELCGKHIAISLIKTIESRETREAAQKIYNELKTQRYWVMYVFPNGNISYNSFKNHKSFEKEAAVYKESKKISNGLLISSDDENSNK